MNQAIASLTAVSSTYFAMKPLRKSFKQTIVKDADGNVVSPFEWAVLTKGHHAATVLKKTGFHQETVFDKEAYEKTKNAFYVVKHAHDKLLGDELVAEAFGEAKVIKTKKTDRILHSMLPSLKNLSYEQIQDKLIDMIKTIDRPATKNRRAEDMVAA